MTTYFPIVQIPNVPPSFSPTLDGNLYNCFLIWNLFGQRYYVNCFDQNSILIFSLPLIETSASIQISSLIWNPASLLVTVTTYNPHGYKIGSTIQLTISGCNPLGFNGEYDVLITDEDTFTFPLSINPGQMTIAGSASYLIDLAEGYFQTSSLIYRNGQFEVAP